VTLTATLRLLLRCGPARTSMSGRSIGSTRSCISSKTHPISPFRTPSVATSCVKARIQLRFWILAARAIPPRAANTFSPYRIGMRVSLHLPACITDAISIFNANKS
jgi:hypothetical protein